MKLELKQITMRWDKIVSAVGTWEGETSLDAVERKVAALKSIATGNWEIQVCRKPGAPTGEWVAYNLDVVCP